MKVTTRNARVDKAGRHNDRNYDVNNSPHIDQSRTSLNRYYTYNYDYEHTFAEIEYGFYEKKFSDYIDAQNLKYCKDGHPERKKTVDNYVHNIRTRPEDKILQLGDMFDHVDGDELWSCALEYAQEFDRLYGDHCKILDMALHMDEATPHVHVRRVWISQDEEGHNIVSQNKSLEDMGFERPDLSKPSGRYNNAKMPFTNSDRELFSKICREHGLAIEESIKKGKQHSEPIRMYKERYPVVEQIKEKEAELDEINAKIAENTRRAELFVNQFRNFIISMLNEDEEYRRRIKEAQNESLEKQYSTLTKLYDEAIKPVMDKIEINGGDLIDVKEIIDARISERRALKFIEKHGLMEQYNKSAGNTKSSKKKEKDNRKDSL